ncbi:hypothetical protein [Actinospica durhamensis]|uniref:hypothetical protein n=1 Tax=Actinospica durhamensis TaxID=1508375 RepID=UPI0034D4E510
MLACAECGRAMEATWSHNHPAYRCRHGRGNPAGPRRPGPAQAFIREQHILDRLRSCTAGFRPRSPRSADARRVRHDEGACFREIRERMRALVCQWTPVSSL